MDIVTHALPSGIYHMASDSSMSCHRFDANRRLIESEQEAFFLRIAGPGDYRYGGRISAS
ncbi:hypothetical protein RA280_10150 [Cupriavidus sp. CV2]|uniref:hypothetical protein n=1 Tax=Cupriavidus ulmosensis TaxID=3065913 RepID=UPI00296B2618|nr:hypothetical protein [Cupriavidus sp. CV2]MDW3682108.1 hypothetical protein [Cupriavidus sp. CV2]